MENKSTMERAFELAREGQCRSLDDIKRKLKAEQYSGVDAHLAGSSIRSQLNSIIRAVPPEE